MPSEERRFPVRFPIFEGIIPLGVHLAIRTQWYRQMARRIRAIPVLGIIPRTDFLTIDEETVEPLPLYTKVPSAGEITVEISTSEKLPDYRDAVPTDDVVAGRKRKRRTRLDGRCRWSAKRRRTEVVVESTLEPLRTNNSDNAFRSSYLCRELRKDQERQRKDQESQRNDYRQLNNNHIDLRNEHDKLPGAGETTIDISPSEQGEMLPEYSEAGKEEDEGMSQG
ncbi:hypothetical protein GE21DRAFT_4993 [Neurospora crassa]|uniref:Uncharacterized protein n=1 Tax=Neurospora crassa (strain ATCC 24698 / 74-OR23-1A / CBS 708.71 / DSM 1257 / FGSC 987) TaxID=367110 RepID=Q7S3N1_NEUCR|nr:hypothetical protein NCU08212 [Neurospora crassa OR74A]EAA30066.1 hypothetical protein NCU08212 [Neurospora crassa OR74A]KHE86459.1 hypothetical protein GE21DRAFT_4993 [Neurospora crassa]|eukprot:XP_959302.1 hypothetical protein NCU08212 [Neurospora crassa OR74A]